VVAYARERPCGGDATLISILMSAPPHGDGRGWRFLVGLPAATYSMVAAAGRRGPRSGRDGRGGAVGMGGAACRDERGGVVGMGGEERRVGMGVTLELFWASPAHENCKKRKKRCL
jgi:hypothetical protein